MTSSALLKLLAEVERGSLTPEAAAERLATLPFEDLGHSRVDHHRSLRIGLPEVVFASGKTAEQAVDIRSEEHTSELQSPCNLVCRLLLEKKKNLTDSAIFTTGHTHTTQSP